VIRVCRGTTDVASAGAADDKRAGHAITFF
jgi:hypothetical protein